MSQWNPTNTRVNGAMVIADDEASNDLYTGQINADVLESVLPSKDNNFYVCGPPGFMNATLGVLREWKVPENQIHHEYFGPPQ